MINRNGYIACLFISDSFSLLSYFHFAKYRFFHFAKYRFPISQSTDFPFRSVPFRFVSFCFVPFCFAKCNKPPLAKLMHLSLAFPGVDPRDTPRNLFSWSNKNLLKPRGAGHKTMINPPPPGAKILNISIFPCS